MKRLSLIVGIAALLFFAPGIASAQGGHGGGGFHGGGPALRGGGSTFHGGGHPTTGGYHAAAHEGRAVAPYGGGWRVHPYSAVGVGVRPSPHHTWVPGYWGFRGGARVWIGGAWLLPQTDWVWMAPHWQWTDYNWVWQQGYWAPPY